MFTSSTAEGRLAAIEAKATVGASDRGGAALETEWVHECPPMTTDDAGCVDLKSCLGS